MNILNNDSAAGKMAVLMLSIFTNAISRFEGRLFGNQAPAYPPIFIIGLPRSGTTLVYQTLCHCVQLAYTPMLTNYLVWMPSLSAWLFRKKQIRYSSDFKSNYGLSKGLASPGEGGMWNIWFLKNKYYNGLNELGKSKAAEIIKFVGRFERIFKSPFINKNLRNNNRIGPLGELFPDAIFIIVLRNPRDVALSLLRARIKIHGDVNQFYSVQPSSHKLDETISPEKSIVDQLNGLLQDINEEMIKIGVEHFLVIHYEEFCSSPSYVLEKISDHIENRGVVLRKRHSPPELFSKSNGQRDEIAPESIEAIYDIIEKEFDWDTYYKLISLRQPIL